MARNGAKSYLKVCRERVRSFLKVNLLSKSGKSLQFWKPLVSTKDFFKPGTPYVKAVYKWVTLCLVEEITTMAPQLLHLTRSQSWLTQVATEIVGDSIDNMDQDYNYEAARALVSDAC